MAKSIEELHNELLELARSYIPSFTIYQDDDPTVILLNLIAMLTNSSNNYSDKWLNNKFIQNVELDTRSKYHLLELFNRLPKPISPSVVNYTVEWKGDIIEEPLVIPQGTRFTVDSVWFTIFDDYILEPSNSYVNIELIEGTLKEEVLSSSLIYNNKLRLNSNRVALDYVYLEIDGELYTQVDNINYSKGTKLYSVEVDMFGDFNLVFPLNINEQIAINSEIYVKYIESENVQNFVHDSTDIQIIDKIPYLQESDVKDNFKYYITTDYQIAEPKYNENSIYRQLTKLWTTYNHAITTDDYISLANYYKGISIARAYDIQSKDRLDRRLYIQTPYLTKMVVAPTEGFYCHDFSKQNLYDHLIYNGLDEEENTLILMNPLYVPIDLTVGLHSTYTRQSDLLNVYNNVLVAVRRYLAVGNIDYGSYISKDFVTTLIIKADPSIEFAELINFEGLQLGATELPLLGRLQLLFNFKKLALEDEPFEIVDEIFIEAHHFLEDQASVTDKAIIIQKLEDSANVDDVLSFYHDLGYDFLVLNDNIFYHKTYCIKYRNTSSESRTLVGSRSASEIVYDDLDFEYDLPITDTGALVTDAAGYSWTEYEF
jgi:hypothetical protein